MNDEMDTYFSNSLKNWAAKQKPAPGGRRRLLQAIKTPPQKSQTMSSTLLKVLRGLSSAEGTILYPDGQWSIVAMTSSNFWFGQRLSIDRLVN